MMERQANALAPRIQMPAEPFKAKANEYIGKFMRQMDASIPLTLWRMYDHIGVWYSKEKIKKSKENIKYIILAQKNLWKDFVMIP